MNKLQNSWHSTLCDNPNTKNKMLACYMSAMLSSVSLWWHSLSLSLSIDYLAACKQLVDWFWTTNWKPVPPIQESLFVVMKYSVGRWDQSPSGGILQASCNKVSYNRAGRLSGLQLITTVMSQMTPWPFITHHKGHSHTLWIFLSPGFQKHRHS